MKQLLQRLANLSRNTGIPQKELQRICLRAGIEQLEQGELRIRPQSLALASPPEFEKEKQEGGK